MIEISVSEQRYCSPLRPSLQTLDLQATVRNSVFKRPGVICPADAEGLCVPETSDVNELRCRDSFSVRT